MLFIKCVRPLRYRSVFCSFAVPKVRSYMSHFVRLLVTMFLGVLGMIPLFSLAQKADSAAVSEWKRDLRLAINLSQAAFSTNWVSGGQSSYGLGGQFAMKGGHSNAGNYTFDYDILLEYGIQKIQGQSIRKTQDRIWLDAQFGRKVSPHWSVFLGGNLLTQFDAGFSFGKAPVTNLETRTLLSRLFAPAYIAQVVGIQYKPSDAFYARLGFGSSRLTVVLDENVYQGAKEAYGVPLGKEVRWEGGMQLNSEFKKSIAKNVTFQTTLYMFTPYTGDQKFKNIDTRIDAAFIAKVNNWLSVTLSGSALYFKSQTVDWQTAQFLAINFLLLDKRPAEPAK
jgi:hypothetical protein